MPTTFAPTSASGFLPGRKAAASHTLSPSSSLSLRYLEAEGVLLPPGNRTARSFSRCLRPSFSSESLPPRSARSFSLCASVLQSKPQLMRAVLTVDECVNAPTGDASSEGGVCLCFEVRRWGCDGVEVGKKAHYRRGI